MTGIAQAYVARGARVLWGAGDGSSEVNAGTSALDIKRRTGTTTSGLYWIRPANASSATQVWCDMTTDGGGWMLVARTHPSATPSAGAWGWRGTGFGTATGYGAGFSLNLLSLYLNGLRFNEYIFGNQLNVISNSWGPFIYKVSLSSCETFMTDDTMQFATAYQTLQANTNVYGSTAFPGMQGAIGFTTTGTQQNIYYMRDCCGFSTYGVTPNGMVTTYVNSESVPWYSGPWVNNTLSGNDWVQGGSSSVTNMGGTIQAIIMVR